MHYTLKVLRDLGFSVTPESRIVDFGCGSGAFIKAARDQGYAAEGCDIYLETAPEAKSLIEQGLIKLIESSPYRLPYDDNSIDFIISETVLEHVMNPEEVAQEIFRVLKPGGAAFHFFPARYAPVESHIFVPLASFFRPYPYLLFWSLLGIRNGYQKEMGAREAASNNALFLRKHTNYLTEQQMGKIYGPYFRRVDFVEKTYLKHSESRKARQVGALGRFAPFLPGLYRKFWMCPLLLVK